MERYRDIDNDSGIEAYEISYDSIAVRFKRGGMYLYTYASAGATHIETMKRLALSGDGLNGYINSHVKHSYARRSA